MARQEAFERVGFASGPLAATACSSSRNSAPFATGKNASELATMSISPPSGRWNRTAMPCGLAFGSPSAMSGNPVPSENRAADRHRRPAPNSGAAPGPGAAQREAALDHHALGGMVGPHARVPAPELIHGVDGPLGQRLVVRGRGERQGAQSSAVAVASAWRSLIRSIVPSRLAASEGF